MISTKKLIKMARIWQKFAKTERKRISFQRTKEDANGETCSTSAAVEKGHFTVYTADSRHFIIPLAYLKDETFRQVLQMSEEEFGLPSDGPIVLPFDALFIEYIVSLIRGGVAGEIHNALLTLVANSRCSSSSSLHHGGTNEQLLAY